MQDNDKLQQAGDFLERKLALCKRYLTVTKRLQKAAVGSESQVLNGFIAERQRCIDQIGNIDTALHRMLAPMKVQFARTRGKLNSLLNRYSAAIRDTLEAAEVLDQALLPAVANENARIKNEMLKMRNGQQAVRRYYGGGGQGPRFIDTFR